MDKNKILNEIQRHEYVSFDLYDTLVKRDVKNPTDVFQLIEEYAVKVYGKIMTGYCKERICAEDCARKKNNKEITLDDIFNCFQIDYSNDILNDLKNKEYEIEYKVTVLNPRIKDIFDYCIAMKKIILITTDIYLSETFIKSILDKVNLIGWTNLYVSSSSGKTKSQGNLYDLILQELKIEPCKLLHIGDNLHSDYEMAKKKGVEAIHIEKDWFQLSYNMYLKSSDMEASQINHIIAFQNNHIKQTWSRDYRLGYECFGPLLAGFSCWLDKQIKKESISNIFFLSRDGKIIKKAFDIYTSNNVESRYFYASRRALQVPRLAEIKDLNKIQDYIYFPDKFTVGSFFKKVGIEDRDIIQKICNRLNTTTNKVIKKNDSNNGLYEKLLYEIFPYIHRNAKEEFECFNGYLKQEGFFGKVAIVDIGWFGNMQSNLDFLANEGQGNVDINGYYIALSPHGNHQKKLKMQGYLYDANHNQQWYRKEILINQVFETIFMAEHGSVKRYIKQGDSFSVKLLEPDLDDSDSIRWLKEYQEGALTFVKDYKKDGYFEGVPLTFAKECAFKQFLKPHFKDAITWGDFKFRDGELGYLAKPKELQDYLKAPKDFISDYKAAYWRIGFLRRVFKINLPYDKIVKLQKRI